MPNTTVERRYSGDEARYGMAYLRYLAGARPTLPSPPSYWRLKPLKAAGIRAEVDNLVALIAETDD